MLLDDCEPCVKLSWEPRSEDTTSHWTTISNAWASYWDRLIMTNTQSNPTTWHWAQVYLDICSLHTPQKGPTLKGVYLHLFHLESITYSLHSLCFQRWCIQVYTYTSLSVTLHLTILSCSKQACLQDVWTPCSITTCLRTDQGEFFWENEFSLNKPIYIIRSKKKSLKFSC